MPHCALRPARALPSLAVAAVATLFAVAAPAPLTASSGAEQVADLATVPRTVGVDPRIVGRFGDHVYFTAEEPTRGRSLWRTDGTAAGTEPFVDLCPGTCGAFVPAFAALDDRFVFTSSISDTPGSVLLWASDGTREGTTLLRRLQNYLVFSVELAAAGDLVFFPELDPEHGMELWATDGTPEGTALYDDACPGMCWSDPRFLTPFGDRLAFGALTPDEGQELWLTGAGPGDARRIVDACPGTCGALSYVAVHDGRLYYDLMDGAGHRQPWASDGTAAGSHRLVALEPAGLSQSFAVGGSVYLVLDTVTGLPKLWRTDGTPAGTAPAHDVLDALSEWILFAFVPPTPGGRVYFHALRHADGTASLMVFESSTGQVRELRTGLGYFPGGQAMADGTVGESLVFYGSDAEGRHLWVSDGTAAGTERIHRISALGFETTEPRWFEALDGLQIFVAGNDSARQLWATDGSRSGTRVLDVGTEPSSLPAELTPFAGHLALTAAEDGVDRELWTTTADGTRVVTAPGAGEPENLTAAAPGLFYTDADDSGRPGVLPEPEGVPLRLSPIERVRELVPIADGRVFFENIGNGQKLWVSDGTPPGTRRVVDFDPDWVDDCVTIDCGPELEEITLNLPNRLTAVGNTLYVRARHPDALRRPGLWKTNGTRAGTVWIEGVPPEVDDLAPLGGGLIASVQVLNDGWQIWRVDPSGAAARIASHGLAWIGALTPADGLVYYVAEERTEELHEFVYTGLALYRTAGGGTGAVRLGLLGGTTRLTDIHEAVAVGDRLFLSLADPTAGTELWTSDGTAAGTRRVVDLWPGPRDANPAHLTPVGTRLVFGADDGVHGHEPWVSDGTAAGTFRLADVHPGPEPSSPTAFAVAHGRLWFAADDGVHGRELWAIGIGALEGPPPAGVPTEATEIAAPEYPGFRFWVRITAAGAAGPGGPVGAAQPARREAECIPETVCVSGALPGRSELFLRIVGPKPNGFLWPTLVRFSTSRIDVWIEQVSTGVLRHYVLDAATPGSSSLDGLFDRTGFEPATD